MTFGQLQTAVYQVCGYPPPVQPVVVGRVKNWINEAHRHCLRQPGLVELRQRSGIQFISTPGQAIYTFGFAFERIDAVVERTSHRRLRSISRDLFRSVDPAETSLGTPTCYVPEGWQPRFAVPDSTGIWAVSSDPFDLTQMVYLTGIRGRSRGDIRPEVPTQLNGNTRVHLGGVGAGDDYVDIISWSLSSICAGDVRLYDSSAPGVSPDTELSRIPAGIVYAQYWCVRLWPTPSGAVTYYVDGQIEIPELVHETDIPMLPPSYHDVLAAFARMREYERTGDSRFAVAAAEWERGIAQMRSFVNFPDDWKPVAGSMSSVDRGSNLGAGFPADWGWP